MEFAKIASDKLLIVAGIVWLIAGVNIVTIGLGAYWHDWGWAFVALLAGSVAVFLLFHAKVFTKTVVKHAARIDSYGGQKTNVLLFFDVKGYIMMAIMMGGGIALRCSGLAPDWFIAFFYTGLGAALALGGASFLIRYFKADKSSCPVVSGACSNR